MSPELLHVVKRKGLKQLKVLKKESIKQVYNIVKMTKNKHNKRYRSLIYRI